MPGRQLPQPIKQPAEAKTNGKGQLVDVLARRHFGMVFFNGFFSGHDGPRGHKCIHLHEAPQAVASVLFVLPTAFVGIALYRDPTKRLTPAERVLKWRPSR